MRIITAFSLSLLICSSLAAQSLKSEAAPQIQSSQTPSKLTLTKAVIALNVNNLEPEDISDTFPSEVKRLFCFTQVKGATEPEEIQHRWYWNDDLFSSVQLKITTGNFRTYSAKTILPTMTGDWRVVIVNSKNEEILYTLKFTVK